MRHFSVFKISVAIFISFISLVSKAQTEIAIAKKYLNQNAPKEKLSTADIARMEVSSAYLSPTTGWYHIYFKQMYESIEVYNGLLNATLKDGKVAYVAHSFVPNLDNIIQQNTTLSTQLSLGKTQISPVQALKIAATNVNLQASNVTEIQNFNSTSLATGLISKAVLRDKNLSNEDIIVQIYWFPYIDETGSKPIQKVALTYNVQFLTKDGKNRWSTHVDVFSGDVLENYDKIVHCDFGKPEHNCASHSDKEFKIFPASQTKSSATLAGNTYNVFDYPLEAPTFGSRTIVTSPYNRFAPAGTGPGATNGWHNDGTTNYTNTKGNNVDAKEDIATDQEKTIGSSPSSPTLDFNYPYTQATGTAAANLNAAITNLFYWNNVLHDVLWRYGFDEPSGNFQNDNMGRGGVGNDFVYADAQDGSGTNNANFDAAYEGKNGRMQLFLFSNAGSPAYTPDSDFDNGIIAHEYGHGWSTRITGGSTNLSCLNNAEKGSEGWSDYLALMTTTKWDTITNYLLNANRPRGIGTYIIGQATTGAGIRPFPYSYNKAGVNNAVTYAKVNEAFALQFPQPHGIGSIWATMLWDMTWEIIFQDNFVAPTIYNIPANIVDYKGNIAALKLVNEGLRIQACNPSFVQARDAILQADNMLFGGRYRCAIGKAFARRGLGLYASTGGTSNDRVVIEDFTPFTSPVLNSALTGTTCSNQTFIYIATTASVGTYTYAWTRAVVSGISNPAGGGSSPNVSEILINTTANPITVQYIFTISPNECGGTPAPQPVNIIVNPTITPTVATYTVCQNASVPSGEGLVVTASIPAYATVNGAIVSGPTYIHSAGNNVTVYSSSGIPVFYKTYTFVAQTTGAVTLTMTAAALSPGTANDTYLSLYQTTFDPANPATNFLIGNDDTNTLLSSVTQTLTAGTTYIVVVSPFATGATGTFTLQASTAVFGQTFNWYLNASGGTPLATGTVFNPVGVAGSGISNTATTGSYNFYVADVAFPECRTLTTFNIGNEPLNVTASGPNTFCSGGSVTLNSNVVNNALNFVKTNSQYVSVPHSASINLGATFTMEAWVRYSGNNSTIIDKGDYKYLWQLNANGNANKMGFYYIIGGTGTWVYSNDAVPENTWTHVAVTHNSGTLTFYINGVASGTSSVVITQDNQPMNIGRQQPTNCACNHFNGMMDELRLWNVVRTPAQIQTNMSGTVPTNSAGLVAYYKFDEGTGTTTADATSNGNNGTFVNSPTWQVPSTSPVNTITWSPGGATTPSIVISTSGTYTATAVNKVGCPKVGSVVVNALASPMPTPQAPAYIPTGGSVSLTATGCSGSLGTYILKWYKASDNSLVTMPVSPTTTTNYYVKCEQTFNSVPCLSMASANVAVNVGDIVNSIITGDWENTGTWFPPRVPLATDVVIINNHTVTITTNLANAKKVDLKSGGSLKYLNGAAKLNVGL